VRSIRLTLTRLGIKEGNMAQRQAGEVRGNHRLTADREVRSRRGARSIRSMMSSQREVLRDTMMRATGYGLWLTLHEVSRLTMFGEASISAQLRHLRKRAYGSFRVEKRRRVSAEVRRTGRLAPVWEYQLRPRRSRRAHVAPAAPASDTLAGTAPDAT
jgi:hypothetical protein